MEESKEKFYSGILLGFAIGAIVWCTLWGYVVGKMERAHKQELIYVIKQIK